MIDMKDETVKRCGIVFDRLDRLYDEVRQDARLSEYLNDSMVATEKEKRILSCLYGALKERDRCRRQMKQDIDDSKVARSCVSLEIICDTLEAELVSKEK